MSYAAQLLGWVALQAAWQTFAIALLLLLSLRLMQEASAARRYRCAVLHLVGAIGAVALSLIASHASVAVRPGPAPASDLWVGWLPGLCDRTRPVLAAVAWIWLGGIAIAQASLAVRFLRLRRFIRETASAEPAVAAMVERMSFDIALSRPPQVRCSDVRSPMVVGRRSTFLIVPRAFGEKHPPAEMRALMAHELAHIVRCDYAWNVLQLFAASLLWWHPGAWLIYARIGHERECASDERAVRIAGCAAPLAIALFRLASASMATEPLPIAAHSSGLAERISRLLKPQECPTRGWVAIFLAGASVALASMILAASSAASHGEALTRAYAASAVGPPTVYAIRARDPAGTFLVKMVRGRVTGIELGQKRVPSHRVVQMGDTVSVLGEVGQELLRVEVDPRGGLRWRPRRAF